MDGRVVNGRCLVLKLLLKVVLHLILPLLLVQILLQQMMLVVLILTRLLCRRLVHLQQMTLQWSHRLGVGFSGVCSEKSGSFTLDLRGRHTL